MTEQVSQPYCEVCGIDVAPNTNLKRFGKFFCSDEHMQQYVRAKQNELGLNEEGERGEERYERRRSRIRFGGGC